VAFPPVLLPHPEDPQVVKDAGDLVVLVPPVERPDGSINEQQDVEVPTTQGAMSVTRSMSAWSLRSLARWRRQPVFPSTALVP